MHRTRGAGAAGEGDFKALYGRAMGRRLQGRRRMRWVATFLGVRDWQVSARDRGQWKAVLEAADGFRPCCADGVRVRVYV